MSGWSNCRPAAPASGDGPRVTASVTRSGEVLTITVNTRAAALYFGGSIRGKNFAVEGDANASGKRLRIRLDREGQLIATGTGKTGQGGRIAISRPFAALPHKNIKAVDCDVQPIDGGCIIMLPDFKAAIQ